MRRRRIATPDRIGAPDAAFTGRPEGGTSFVWKPSAPLPRVFDSDIGLLLTEFPGGLDRQLVEKLVPPGTTIEPVTVDGAAGYWLGDGVHEFFYLDADGEPQPDTARLAANTLLWERDGVTYRLESALDRDAAARNRAPAHTGAVTSGRRRVRCHFVRMCVYETMMQAATTSWT